jgi:hemerythrin
MLNYPQVALAFMNRDHAEFVELLQRITAALTGQEPSAHIDALLDELLAHTRAHFAEEERRMQEVQFPPFPMHQGEHQRVLADMETQVATWKSGRDAAALQDWLSHAVSDWFIAHVSSMDFVTAAYIAARGGQ